MATKFAFPSQVGGFYTRKLFVMFTIVISQEIVNISLEFV